MQKRACDQLFHCYPRIGTFALLTGFVVSSCSAFAQTAALAKAGSSEREGLYEDARDDYKAILKQFPSSREARLGLARNQTRLGYCADAAEVLKKGDWSPEDNVQQQQWLGICYFEIGDPEKAISELTQAVKVLPGDKGLRISLARSFALNGEYQSAIDSLHTWSARYGNDADVLYWTGKFYEELSEQTFERMEKEDPNSYLVLQINGDQLLKKRKYPEALAAYRRALSAKPDTPGLHFDVGNVYWRMSEFDKAREEMEKELELNPHHPLANYELGDIYVKFGDPTKAIPYLERALRTDPSLVEAHRSMGKAFSLEKDYRGAIKEFEFVAAQNASDNSIHALLAATYRKMGQLKKADEETQIYERLTRASQDLEEKAASQRLQIQQHPLTTAPPSSPPH
jgi:tetratricopeptide (TPR) repeat protein